MSTLPLHKSDPDKTALCIKAAFAMRGIKITAYAKRLGVSRQLLSQFLNRHLNLHQDQIEWILEDLGIQHLFE